MSVFVWLLMTLRGCPSVIRAPITGKPQTLIAWHRQAFPVQNRVLSATVLRTFAVGLLSAVLKRLWISSKDLEAIQKRALEEGLPYQTLIASLLHKFASGRLKEA